MVNEQEICDINGREVHKGALNISGHPRFGFVHDTNCVAHEFNSYKIIALEVVQFIDLSCGPCQGFETYTKER
jgi:hypothetical protein